MPKLTVILVEYFSLPDIRACIASLQGAAEGVQLSVLVISNSEYSAEDLSAYQSEFGAGVFHTTGANMGYAGGVNFGIRLAQDADFYLILNPDARWSRGQLSELLSTLQEEPEIGILGPSVVDELGQKQPSSRAFPTPLTVPLTRTFLARTPMGKRECERYFRSKLHRQGAAAGRSDEDWVSGGAMVLSRETALRIGPMDDRYFMYMEDVDWCRSAWAKGLRVVHDTRWEVRHAGRHASLRPGLFKLLGKQTRCHVGSIVMYYLKWRRLPGGWSGRPEGAPLSDS